MSETPSTTRPPARPRTRGWRIFFTVFKWCRVALLLTLLCLLLALIFLHQAGLPVALQEQLVARLRDAGWDVHFTHLRLRWYHGIVAERFSLSRTNDPAGPALFVERAQFQLNWPALRSLRLQADGLRLTEGRLVLPPPPTAPRDQGLVIDRIHGDVRFHPGDHWELGFLEGRCLGFKLRLRGELTNALRVREWRLPRRERETPPEAAGQAWRRLLAQLRRIQSAVPPELQVQFTADGADPRTLGGTLRLSASAFVSPWASATNLSLVAWLRAAPATNQPQRAGVTLASDGPQASWGRARRLLMTASWEASLSALWPTEAELNLDLRDPEAAWGRAQELRLGANLTGTEGPTNALRLSVRALQLESRLGRVRNARLNLLSHLPASGTQPFAIRLASELEDTHATGVTSGYARAEATMTLPAWQQFRVGEPGLDWPARWQSVEGGLSCRFSNTLAAGLQPRELTVTNTWLPDGGLRLLAMAEAAGARLTAQADLDPATRRIRLDTSGRGQPQSFLHLLPPAARAWLDEPDQAGTLEVHAVAGLTLPPWEQPAPDWRREVWPTLGLTGRVQVGPGRFRQVPFTSLTALGHYTNRQVTLPEIRLHSSAGLLEGEADLALGTAAFRARAKAALDPQALRPAFPPKVQRQVLDLFTFSTPPRLMAEAHGNWKDWSTLSLTGDATLTNFTVRSQAVASVQSRLLYTNQFLTLLQPVLLRAGGERGDADVILFDTATERLYLTNAQGNLNPVALARAIGPIVSRALQPYAFDTPPRIRANGLLPLRPGDDGEDAWFDVEGGPFHWQRFHCDQVRARIHWLGEARTVTLTNLAARWCGADAAGWLHLDFSRPLGGAMALHAAVEGADLGPVVRDLQGGVSNRLEGTFRGELNITEAFLDDPHSWQGNGRVELREGLIWDIPLFAVVSPLLNRVIPGLGQSRAREGRATCVISNSVIHSRDLEIRASAMQLKYRGAIDFQGNLDAIMEAELFRNVPGLGMVLSKVLWPVTKLFEYRVGGTLNSPRLEERYFIPKVLLLPLQPIKTMKDLLGPEKPAEPAPGPAP